MKSTRKNIIYRGNSIISIENLPEYAHPVIVKKPAQKHPSERHIRSLEKEDEMTRVFDKIRGVRKVLDIRSIKNLPVLILENIDGQTLLEYSAGKKLSLRSKLKIAVGLARILGEIHKKNIIHLDINSSNILIGSKKRTVHFIDLGSAHQIDRSGLQKVGPDQLLGKLPYIAPEQTGRINRAVDERSDLYSLGVVLYELMTGQLPFDSKDPLELVHQHIARIPLSPSAVLPEIPEMISAIIMKLLAKNAEDRYQSAAGIQADLEKCLRRLSPDNTIEEFPLGETDYSNRLIFPQNLYGRDRELKELERAFESVCRDTASILFVGGYSGVGKTVLVEEIQRPVSEKNGYFIQGKFDQLATTPYSGIAQALTRLVSQILTQTETQLTAWRSKILEAVGPNGRVLTDIVPSLELVIGSQPDVPDLSGQEAQNRFHYVIQCFFRAVARSEHPICFFLDDLQWIDPGSLGLLKNLFSSPDLAHLLVVGAYRDNEVHKDHPLMTLIASLEGAGINLKKITLQNLSKKDVDAMISDILRRESSEIREFSRLIHTQTNGNPFFSRQVLRSLEDQSLLALDTATGRWFWDMDALRDLDIVDSVVELLVGKLKVLPADTQDTLKVAACIGNQFDIATLTVVTAGEDEAILDHLQEAVTAGLIWESGDHCHFVHDRVQEAAYTLVPQEDRDRTHLSIGRLLLQRQHGSDHEQDLYQVVDQLNHGLHLVEDEQERMQLARLNLQAARAARQASAFETGLNYAQAGIELFGENSWDQDYQLTLALHEQAALLAHAAGDIPAMEQHSEQVLQRGRDPLDLARVQRLHVEFLLSSKSFDEAIDYGLRALRILGQEFPPDPDMAFATAKLSELLERLERDPPDYFSMPRLYDQDPELLAVSEILRPVANAAFISRPALAPLMYMHILELSLGRRLLPENAPGMISVVGMFANAFLGRVEVAHAYGETAVELASRAAFHTSIHVPLQVHGLYSHFWRESLRETLDLFDRGIQSAHDCGDNEFVAYMSHSWSKHAFYVSIELARVEERSLSLRTFVDGIQYLTQSRWINTYVTAVQALRGNSSAQGTTWRGTPFDDDRDLPDLQRVEDQLGLLYMYCAKAWVATLFGDHDGVEEYADLSYPFLVAAPVGLEKAILTFISGLRRARELRVTPESSESEQALQEQLDLLERFAGLAPMNFAHKLSLVQAEVHRARGEVLPAMQAYEKAAQGALENDYLNEAGLAYALAAEFHRDIGLHQAALDNVEKAALVWRSWGADALVESLSHRFADLLETSGISAQISTDEAKVQTTATRHISSIQMDLDSILDASKTLSSEMDLDQLKAKMMKLLMTESGATKTLLMLKQEDNWFVQARSDEETGEDDANIKEPYDPAKPEDAPIPSSVFNYCLRTKEVVVVGDARHDSRFTEDRIVQAGEFRSMACIPVLSKGEVKAMIYLENRQLADVFNPERIEVLKHLSSQFSISMENAQLYDSLNRKLYELQVSESRFRSVVENAKETIVVAQDKTVKFSNPRVYKLTGYTPEEVRSQDFLEFIHPKDRENVLREYQSRVSGERATGEYSVRIITKDGQEKHVLISSALIDWEDRPATLALITDITDIKHTEEELRKSEEHFRKMMEQSPLAMAIFSSDGQFTDVNPAWYRQWGMNKEEATEFFARYNHRTDKQLEDLGVAPLVERAYAGESIILPPIEYIGNRTLDELGMEDAEASSRWVQIHLYPIMDENGSVASVVNTNVDITELKQAEQETQEQKDLLARVGRTSRMGQLTGSIAHELSQPLTGILSSAQALEIIFQENQEESGKMTKIVERIIADAKRSRDVIHSLRELYGEQKGKYDPNNINAVVDKTIQLLRSEIVLHQIKLKVECSPALPQLYGNAIQLQQVLLNLIMNAIQALKEVARDNRYLLIKTNHNTNNIKTWVEDRGQGIPPDKIDRIFEPLATWKPGGTGMGLAISNSIIEAHGGKMWAENKPEGGARVGFILPVMKKGQ